MAIFYFGSNQATSTKVTLSWKLTNAQSTLRQESAQNSRLSSAAEDYGLLQ
jgi:hypothetical protein